MNWGRLGEEGASSDAYPDEDDVRLVMKHLAWVVVMEGICSDEGDVRLVLDASGVGGGDGRHMFQTKVTSGWFWKHLAWVVVMEGICSDEDDVRLVLDASGVGGGDRWHALHKALCYSEQ